MIWCVVAGESELVATCECGYPTYGFRPPHPQQHDTWLRGLRARPSARYETAVAAHGVFKITLVKPSAPRSFWGGQIGGVVAVANREVANREGQRTTVSFKVGLDGFRERQQHALLGRVGDHIVAILAFDLRTMAGYRQRDAGEPALAEYLGGKWTVRFVWVLPAHRRKGLASRLLEATASVVQVPISDLAWEPPFSPDGVELVRRHCPTGYWLAGYR